MNALYAFPALGAFALGCVIAWHYPLAPALASAMFVLWSIAAYVRPVLWLVAVPALLPVIAFAPWTGWLTVEEFDLVVLGAAAGGYASMIRPIEASPRDDARVVRLPFLSLSLLMIFGASTVVALYRGIVDAGTLELGWTTGYYDALNSLRVAKGFLLAVFMTPLLQSELQKSGNRALNLLALGLACALGLESVAVIWERLAFTGLLNFSRDYRVTGSFWEMHVGGAALDGFLALTFPFALWEILRHRGRARWVFASALTLIAGYACLVTFSRGVYLAVPVSIGVLIVLQHRQQASLSAKAAGIALLKVGILIIAAAAGSYLVFRAGGYRSLLAVLAVLAIALPLGVIGREVPPRSWLMALVIGAFVAAVGFVAALAIPKGPYAILAVAFLCCAVLLREARHPQSARMEVILLAAFAWLVIAAALVALHWGGTAAFVDSVLVLSVIAVLTMRNAMARVPLWRQSLRLQGSLFGIASLVALVVAVFSGGAYMTDRFSESERDLAVRIGHWRDGLRMLDSTTDWLLGKGMGRFPQSYLFRVRDGESPGSYTIGAHDGKRYLILSGPGHEGDFGEILRIGQRIPMEPGTYSLMADLRAPREARVHFEVCEKQLLYNANCAIASVNVPATGSSWQRQIALLDGRALSGGPWYAPRLGFFAIAVETPERVIDVDNISLIGPDGRNALANSDFAQGMTHWFLTSDRFHLPWHVKNMLLDVLFDQGLIGLLLFVLLTGAAMWRLVVGKARMHPAAPFLASSLAGFIVVGAFDSLLDVPRVAFLFYLVVVSGFLLPPDSPAPRPRP